VWKGLKPITDYKSKSPHIAENLRLVNDLNDFYCRFERDPSSHPSRTKGASGAPQGCVLSPLLFSLYTNDCTSKHPSVKFLKFADDTSIIGLIRDGEESAYRHEVEQLVKWCSQNHLELNPKKTVEMTVERPPPPTTPSHHPE